MAVARCAVLPSSVSPSGNGMNGLGAASRESGQRRVPAPPERMTGMIGDMGNVRRRCEGRVFYPGRPGGHVAFGCKRSRSR
jgi:hypothetical protein